VNIAQETNSKMDAVKDIERQNESVSGEQERRKLESQKQNFELWAKVFLGRINESNKQ